jgi:hypothetical protein
VEREGAHHRDRTDRSGRRDDQDGIKAELTLFADHVERRKARGILVGVVALVTRSPQRRNNGGG